MTPNFNDQSRFDDALDGRGILKDGKSLRVAAHLRDHATVQQMFLDGRSYWDSERDKLQVTDAGALDVNGNRPGWRIADSGINRQAITDAYRSYEDGLVNPWRNPPNTK